MKEDELQEARRQLFAGLYDGDDAKPAESRAPVRLLNPLSQDEDATARRFAMLEVD